MIASSTVDMLIKDDEREDCILTQVWGMFIKDNERGQVAEGMLLRIMRERRLHLQFWVCLSKMMRESPEITVESANMDPKSLLRQGYEG